VKRTLSRNPPPSKANRLTLFGSLREILYLCVFAPWRLCVLFFQQPGSLRKIHYLCVFAPLRLCVLSSNKPGSLREIECLNSRWRIRGQPAANGEELDQARKNSVFGDQQGRGSLISSPDVETKRWTGSLLLHPEGSLLANRCDFIFYQCRLDVNQKEPRHHFSTQQTPSHPTIFPWDESIMGRFGPAIGSAGRFFWAQRRCLVTVLCDLSLALPLFPL